MNKTSNQILDEYKTEFMDLENSYYELSGHCPAWDEWEFWESSKVKRTYSLLEFWWDIAEILNAKCNSRRIV